MELSIKFHKLVQAIKKIIFEHLKIEYVENIYEINHRNTIKSNEKELKDINKQCTKKY